MPPISPSNLLHVVDHPLVLHHLTRMRDVSTPPPEFRRIVRRLTWLVASSATAGLSVEPVDVRTPLGPAGGHRLVDRVGLVPIIRAGLAMVDPVLDLIPDAEVRHLGLYRDEETLQPVEYYQKLPAEAPVDVGLVLDPMLATGGSATAAIDAVKTWGVPRVVMLALIASPEGVQAVHADHPDTEIFVCAIDKKLNDRGYILPGLGDAGDRVYNTEGHPPG